MPLNWSTAFLFFFIIWWPVWIILGSPGYRWCYKHWAWYRWLMDGLRAHSDVASGRAEMVEKEAELEAEVERLKLRVREYELAFEAVHHILDVDPDDIEFAVARWKEVQK